MREHERTVCTVSIRLAESQDADEHEVDAEAFYTDLSVLQSPGVDV